MSGQKLENLGQKFTNGGRSLWLGASVPKFVDLGGRRHPVVNNFPLSRVIFKVNFPLSNDPLALVSAKRLQQRHNTGLSLKSTWLS